MAQELDISNDPEVERLGANAAAQYALQFWNRLAEAARKDGRLLDPIWEDFDVLEEDTTNTCNSQKEAPSAHYTTQIVVTSSLQEDLKLHRRFRSNFSGFPVDHIRQSPHTPNPLGGERWTSLLVASEGLVDSYNFMTLLRADAHSMFWMSETKVCDGLVIVPRAQFVFLEVTRIREAVYDQSFRAQLQLFDVKTQADILQQALEKNQEDAVLKAVYSLRTQWPYPRRRAFQQSGVVGIVKRGFREGSTEAMRTACCDLLQYWQDVLDLGRIPRELQGVQRRDRMVTALQRAGKALVDGSSNYSASGGDTSTKSTRMQVPTRRTSSFSDLVVPDKKDAANSSRIFRTFGMCVLQDLISDDTIVACKQQASEALEALKEEHLKPRGLQVDGLNSFDFAEVRQRPGHRVDNRYHILEDPTSPIATLSRYLLDVLPNLLTKGGEYKLLYGGVVHSFPRENAEDPIPPAQLWHRDGPSLFETGHHDTHCFNVFVPLIDVTTENGTTEFIPGTHNDDTFQEMVGDVLSLAQTDPAAQHDYAVRAQVSAGTVLVFDVRVLHRGLANASMVERPMMYFTFSRDWFLEKHMFQETSIVQAPPDDSQVVLVKRLYELVTGGAPPEGDLYGHPHYTTRFDLLLLEELSSSDTEVRARATKNVAAVMALASSSSDDKTTMAREFVELLGSPSAVERKHNALQEAKAKRTKARKAETAAYLDYTDWQSEVQDFSSITADMSDIEALYDLTAEILLQESEYLSRLGFTKDRDGICVLLAALKAVQGSKILEECFTSWWHAGHGRFSFQSGHVAKSERSTRKVLVVFSSLGSGIARPEWSGSLRNVSSSLDILNVLDPAFSWYCQDPSCDWKGGEYYERQLAELLEGYKGVMFIGDSMGAAAALRFSSLATNVLAFTPQVDISQYEAITRVDFPQSVRRDFQNKVVSAMKQTNSNITIHYGERCEEDVRQVSLLPKVDAVKLVAHDYDDHILSLHLRDIGKLQEIVEEHVNDFLQNEHL